MATRSTKKCPRCGEKCFAHQPRCDYCGLIFDRLKNVSNKAGKKAVLKGEKEKVVYLSEFPSDLKRWKVLLLCGFLGMFGAHNFYVGRYWKGGLMLLGGLIAFVLSGFSLGWYTETVNQLVEGFLFIPMGLTFLFWLYDFLLIAIKKYKVPVAPKEEKI